MGKAFSNISNMGEKSKQKINLVKGVRESNGTEALVAEHGALWMI